jgi:hypothetical protein
MQRKNIKIYESLVKYAVFWDVTPCDSRKNRRFEESIACIIRVTRIAELVTANVVPSRQIIVILMMEAVRCSETLVLTRTRRIMPEDGILHRHRRENLKSYIALTGWALQWRSNMSPVRYELGIIPEN